MSSLYIERVYCDLPDRYMGLFTNVVNKCITEWGYKGTVEKPRFVVMMLAAMIERAMLDIHVGSEVCKPTLAPDFLALIDEHNIFTHSPFSKPMEYIALSALQSVYLMDSSDFSFNADFWETICMDVLSSIVQVSSESYSYRN